MHSPLIFEKLDNCPIQFIGPCSVAGKQVQLQSLPRDFSPLAALGTASSKAPLASVCRTQVFILKDTEVCIGIVVTYETGARYSLGQCRLSVDSVLEYVSPTRVCFINAGSVMPDGRKGLKVLCSTKEQAHEHAKPVWTCCGMRGYLSMQSEGAIAQLEHGDA